MAYGFEPVQSQPWGGGQLASLLATLAAQGQRQRFGAYAGLGQGLTEMLQGFERQGDLMRQKQFTDSQRRAEEAYRSGEASKARTHDKRMATDRYSVEGARDRRRTQAEVAQAGKNRAATELQHIEGMQADIARAIASALPGTDTSRLQSLWNALEARKGGLGKAGGMPVPQAPPGAGPAFSRVFSPNVQPTGREETEAVSEAAAMSAPMIRTSPYRVRDYQGPPDMRGMADMPALPTDDPRLAGLAKRIRASENAVDWLRKRPVQDDDIKRRIAKEEKNILDARTSLGRSGAEILQERVAREIGSDAAGIFTADAMPSSPKSILYKTVLADMTNGEMDEARLVARARDRLADREFAKSAGLDRQRPTDAEILAFIKIAAARTGRGNR